MIHVRQYTKWILWLIIVSPLSFADNIHKQEPVHIQADEISFEKELNKATALGHVTVTKGASKLKAEKVEAYFSKGEGKHKIYLIKAFKEVKIENPNHVATGDEGIYDVEKEEVILEGNVTVNDRKNTVHGAYGVMNQKTGITRVLNHNPHQSKPKECSQVSALLVSSEDQ